MFLEVLSLSAKWGEIAACGPVSFSLEKDKALGLRGINGAGKSSLLRAMAGLPRPKSSGDVRLEVVSLFENRRTSKKVTLVPEGRRLFPSLTVEENLRVAFHGKKADFLAKEEEIFAKVPTLWDWRKKEAGVLSGGQQQLVAIARALMTDPALLLVDEPFLGLSPKARQEVANLLQAEKESGRTLIFTCQDEWEVSAFCDRILCLSCGQAVFFGSYSEGIRHPLFPSKE